MKCSVVAPTTHGETVILKGWFKYNMAALRNLNNKRVIVTGASSGIGRALAIEAARRGAKVVLVGRNTERLNAAAAAARSAGGSMAIPLIADVTEPIERERIMHAAETQFGGLDILVNNAGIGATGHFQDADPERLRRIMEVNFFGPAELARLAIPLLKVGSDPAIVMINSVVGRRAIPARPEYSASKFALTGLAEALRAELVKDGIEVTTIFPGLTATEFEEHMLENRARLSLHKDRWMTAEEAARQTWNAVEHRKHETVLTLKGKLLVLINRLAPRFIDFKMAQLVRKLYAKELQKTH